MNKTCYDCGREKHRGTPCVPLSEPAPGTSYRLDTFQPDGITGNYGVDILDEKGAVIAGILHTRRRCEALLLVRGFRPPFKWPTPEESRAAREAERQARKARARR